MDYGCAIEQRRQRLDEGLDEWTVSDWIVQRLIDTIEGEPKPESEIVRRLSHLAIISGDEELSSAIERFAIDHYATRRS